MQSELKQLRRNKVCYLGNVTPSRKVEFAFSLAAEFFNGENFVPGFPDLLVLTSRKSVKKITSRFKAIGELHLSVYVRHYKNLPKFEPDMIWIDDAEAIAAISKKYPGIPTIHSACRPNGDGINIVVDSREQKPLFNGDTFSKQSLIVGDYTTDKLLNKFHVERKSPEDLYGTITKNHVRFRNELIRAEVNSIKLVMFVECCKKDFIAKKFSGGNMRLISGETLGKIVDTVENRYNLEVVWCASRNNTKSKILKRLKLEEKMSSKKSKNVGQNHKLKPEKKTSR